MRNGACIDFRGGTLMSGIYILRRGLAMSGSQIAELTKGSGVGLHVAEQKVFDMLLDEQVV
jgi:hypothetical protein